MPNDDDYASEVIRTVADLTRRTEELSQQLSQQLAIHRDTVFRAISLLNHEVIGFTERLNQDDKARVDRQQQLDGKLELITSGQRQIQNWQWIRVCVEVAAVIVVIAFLIGTRQ